MNNAALTHRIPMDRTFWLWLRCSVGLCLWARWELGTAKVKSRVIDVEIRESICCGRHQVRAIVLA